MTSARPEHQLLLSCARRMVGGDDTADSTPLLAEALDWDYLLNLAGYHQIVPLLHQAVVTERRHVVPPAPLESLQGRWDRSVARARWLAAELIRVLELASRAGIAVIPFKGPVLATDMYGSLTRRQFDDLDLLIDPAQSAQGEQLLTTLGYRRRKDFGYEVKLIHQDHGSCIDLHRGLSSRAFPIPLRFAPLWARRRKTSLHGSSVETLSVEDLFIVLCLQVARDAWQGRTRLAKICDIGQVLRSEDRLDWMRIAEEAASLQIRRMVAFGLHLAVQILRLSLPQAASPRRPPRAVAALLRQEEHALFAARRKPSSSLSRSSRMYFHLRERWPAKLAPYWWLYVVPRLRPIRRYARSFLGKGET